MKIAVTGADGFVAREFLRQAESLSLPSLELYAYGHKLFDLADSNTWHDKCVDGLDCFINAGVRIDGELQDIYETNTLHVHELSKWLENRGCHKLINLSTGAVYGPTDEVTSPESDCNPLAGYPASKYLGEMIFDRCFSRLIHHLRLYYPYGPGQKLPRLIPTLVNRIIDHKPVYHREDGGPFISMSHVTDIGKVILEQFVLRDMAPGVYNLATEEAISMASIIKTIEKCLGKTARIKIETDTPDVISKVYGSKAMRSSFNVDRELLTSMIKS